MIVKFVSNSVVNRGGKRRLPAVLSAEEQERLLAVPNRKVPTGLRNYCMLRVFLNTGLRLSEALALEMKDIDWVTGRFDVRAGKGGKDRVLWLGEAQLEELTRWCSLRPSASGYVFSTLKGGPMNDRYVREFVGRYAKKGGIEKSVYPHLLRHTFATDLLRKKGNIRLVQKALGHTSLATTMIYTHITDDQLEEALKTFRG